MERAELKPREEAFCRAYAEKYNGTQAALVAGYGKGNEKSAAHTAWRLLRQPEIKARITELLENSANEAGATKLYIAQKLKETVDRCLQEVKPKMIWDGEEGRMVESGDYVFNARDAVNALKVLADIQGMAKETKRLEGAVEITMPEVVAEYGD